MLKCYIVKGLLPGHVDGRLGKESTAEVEQHLRECDDCRSALLAFTLGKPMTRLALR